MDAPVTIDHLPEFPSPTEPVGADRWRLTIDGLVERPCVLSIADLRAMGLISFTLDFACVEGWKVEGLRWSGVSLVRLVAHVRPLPSARYVEVGAGRFVSTLALDAVQQAEPCLALDLDGRPVPWAHGGPLRLVTDGGVCHQSVKWVERLTFTTDARGETAARIALARVQRANQR